jgi:hypothetical protein
MYTAILLSLLSFSVKMTVSPWASALQGGGRGVTPTSLANDRGGAMTVFMAMMAKGT